MFTVFIQAFAIQIGLIIAIGAQNAFVLKCGLKKQTLLTVVLICAFCDAVLISLGALGFGVLLRAYPFFVNVMYIFAIIYLLIYGFSCLRNAFFQQQLDVEVYDFSQYTSSKTSKSIYIKNATLALAVTLLNPHVYIDTVVFLGGLAGQYVGLWKLVFCLGAIFASFIWFFSIGYGARFLAPLFKKPLSWKVLDFLIGVMMWFIAYQLYRSFLT